jgi:hypothetical protein
MTNPASNRESQVSDWLALAPQVPQLANGQQWHVFLSYRSVNRTWVLHLYDALRTAGFAVFVDQLEIAAGDSLARRLNNALTSSQSGVIVWSTHYGDSEWCQSEYESMEALRTGGKFRFVVVKLSAAVDLPPLVKKDVYVDFSDYPDGPQGGELLKLMYGLLAKPLPAQVLLAAQAIDEQTKRSLASIRGAKAIGNVKKLMEVAAVGGSAWQASPLLYSATADALIEMDECDRALEVLKFAALSFPNAVRPIQLRALAFARKAKRAAKRANDPALQEAERTVAREEAVALLNDAQQGLAELVDMDHRDPETLGIFARTWMDKYALTNVRAYLAKSRDLYALAFKLNDDDYYTGINAAAKSLFLGERKEAAEYASRVEALVGVGPISGDYWKTATVAEAQLLQSHFDQAAKLYRAAVVDAATVSGSHASTRGQAELILAELDAPAEVRSKVLQSFVL